MKELLSTRTTLSLAAARRIAQTAEARAIADGLNVSIAIVDDAGRLLHFQRMDGSPNSSVEVAIRKAEHAANYRRDTVFHQELLSQGHHVVLGLPHSLPIEGGVRLQAQGQSLGAIGVAGAPSAQDGEIARAGAELLDAL
ncbi:hypothetical protein ASD78_15270 [Lysobacter sp. Root667]|uniref:GlcG/HbpS family heme-binding protein n=1 Tax=Lysobacter sp. Root667 TaxID=1736581 RepID=UPI0006F4B13A|nr:heme-binding protein [Lysobacter sp. Root667]KRA72968.1 hypothetical protein ASD78_15270 [Lysobacter sp. Root667]